MRTQLPDPLCIRFSSCFDVCEHATLEHQCLFSFGGYTITHADTHVRAYAHAYNVYSDSSPSLPHV